MRQPEYTQGTDMRITAVPGHDHRRNYEPSDACVILMENQCFVVFSDQVLRGTVRSRLIDSQLVWAAAKQNNTVALD